MITRLLFAAPFVYFSKGTSPISIKSWELRNRIKRGDSVLFRQLADHVADLVAAGRFPNFFGADVTLVPVPGHTPLMAGAFSATQRISRTLAENGLAAEVNTLVVRAYSVPKSPGRLADRSQTVARIAIAALWRRQPEMSARHLIKKLGSEHRITVPWVQKVMRQWERALTKQSPEERRIGRRKYSVPPARAKRPHP